MWEFLDIRAIRVGVPEAKLEEDSFLQIQFIQEGGEISLIEGMLTLRCSDKEFAS